MRLSHDQVVHIAELARLAIGDDETERFAEQLSDILSHFQALGALDTSAVPPTAHPIDRQNVTRRDIVCPSLPHELALANAPRQRDGFFRVIRILEG